MTHRAMAVIGYGALIWLVDLPGPGPPNREAGAAAQVPDKTKRPDPIPPPSEPPDPDFDLKDYTATTDQVIQLFEARVKRDPNDFTSLRYLGEFYERRAKESGDLACYAKAEAALRQSLKLFPDAPRVEATLGAVLCARHRFAEALAIARKLTKEDPRDIDALATLSDTLLDTGRYAEAEEALKRLHDLAPVGPVLARMANLAELKGDADKATDLMTQADERVRKRSSDPKAVAWYQSRLGDIAFNTGRLDQAERYYRAVPP